MAPRERARRALPRPASSRGAGAEPRLGAVECRAVCLLPRHAACRSLPPRPSPLLPPQVLQEEAEAGGRAVPPPPDDALRSWCAPLCVPTGQRCAAAHWLFSPRVHAHAGTRRRYAPTLRLAGSSSLASQGALPPLLLTGRQPAQSCLRAGSRGWRSARLRARPPGAALSCAVRHGFAPCVVVRVLLTGQQHASCSIEDSCPPTAGCACCALQMLGTQRTCTPPRARA